MFLYFPFSNHKTSAWLSESLDQSHTLSKSDQYPFRDPNPKSTPEKFSDFIHTQDFTKKPSNVEFKTEFYTFQNFRQKKHATSTIILFIFIYI